MSENQPAKKPLKSLSEFNADREEVHRATYDGLPRPNGIACPKCGGELLDSSPMITLTSYPPQKNVHCPACDYTGYRIA